MNLAGELIKTKAIVLKEIQLREADKILVCLSSELGKFTVSARGVKNNKSSNIAASSFLAYSEMLMYTSRDMYSLSQSNVIEAFYDIRTDVVRLTYASYFADILLDSIQENEEAEKVLRLLLNTLFYLSDAKANKGFLASLFELKLLKYIGYTFNTKRCCLICGKQDVSFVSFTGGGFVCRECRGSGDISVSVPLLDVIGDIVDLPLKKAFDMEIPDICMADLRKVTVKYLTVCLDKYYTKLDFLNTL
jgi:DNA repair protein RecO (recombination protein O)